MKTLSITQLPIQPEFDFSTFLFLSQLEELGPRDMVAVLDVWDKWLPHLKVYKLGDRKEHVLVFLDQAVEDQIDEIWGQAPSEGFKHEAIAQTMIMGTLKTLMPELGDTQCAPVPVPTKPLCRTLEKIGLDLQESGALNRKYATLTPYPHRYGCERCHLKDSCIKNMNLDLSGIMKPQPKAE